MKKFLRERTLIVLMALIVIAHQYGEYSAFAEVGELQLNITQSVFPSVRSYTIKDGVFAKTDIKRFYIVAPQQVDKASRLKEVVSLVSREFIANGLISARTVDIVYGDGTNIKVGDIIVKLADDHFAIKQAEGYIIDITNKVVVTANSANGVMYGLRTVMAYLFTQNTLPQGTIVDYPEVAERGLHIDIGRKYFTANWLKSLIKEMSFCKLNSLQLHFSENQGFRLECSTYPEIVSKQHLAKAEMRQIIETARQYGISIIPSLDSPGHLRSVLAQKREFRLVNRWGDQKKRALDINNDEARQFIKNILSEYAELFSESSYFHIGGDEFIDFNDFDDYPSLAEFGQKKVAEGVIANGLDGYTAYINEIAEHVQSLGFTPRIWNDGVYRRNMTSHVSLNDDIQICYWSRWDKNIATVDELMAKGHQLINTSEMMYYVLEDGVEDVSEYDFEVIYNTWHAGVFQGGYNKTQTYQTPHSNILGACYAIWCDHPNAQTEREVAEGIYYPLRAMAEKSWAGQRADGTPETFKALLDESGRITVSIDHLAAESVLRSQEDFATVESSFEDEFDKKTAWLIQVLQKMLMQLFFDK